MGIANHRNLLLHSRLIKAFLFLAQTFILTGYDMLEALLAIWLNIRIEVIATSPALGFPLSYRNHQGMEMWGSLIQMTFKSEYVLFTKFTTEELIILQCQSFNLFETRMAWVVSQRDGTVILAPVEIHWFAESNLRHAVVVAVEHKVNTGVRLVRSIGRPRLEFQFLQSFIVSLF